MRANFAGAKSDAGATDIQVFAFGPGAVDWGQSDPNAVAVELDKKSYAVGDTATAVVASPFDRADVYVSVIRGDALYRTTLRNVSGSARVTFHITQDMLPNAAIEAVVVRRGANIASIKPGTLDTLSRVGMAAFDVDVAQRYLTLGIAPQAFHRHSRRRPARDVRADAQERRGGSRRNRGDGRQRRNLAVDRLPASGSGDDRFCPATHFDDAFGQSRERRAENAGGAGRERLWLRWRVSGRRGQHPRALSTFCRRHITGW